MKILGIDTTTKFLCLGLYDDGRIYEYNLELLRLLSNFLVPHIKRILEALNWQLNKIDYFACGLGPGSFTGVRVGLATIKGIAWSLNKPILGISTLDILAKNVKIPSGYVAPIIDAKRNLIYTSIYKANKGKLKRITPYLLLSEKEFYKRAKKDIYILGDAVLLYKENILKNVKGANILEIDYWYPQARNIIDLALEKIRRKEFSNIFKIKPIYLYPKECQIRNSNLKAQMPNIK